MSQSIQWDFFDDSIDYHQEEIKHINLKVDNVRKGLFKRHGELSKMYVNIWERQEKLENRIYAIEQALKLKEFNGVLAI